MAIFKAILAAIGIALPLSGCNFSLGLEILNAGNQSVEVAVGSKTSHVSPGLSFQGKFPAPEDHDAITVTAGSCRYRYILPNLDAEPWRSLIGKSIKFRWFEDGRLVAYPPTPDVRIESNPQRAVGDAALSLPAAERTCH